MSLSDTRETAIGNAIFNGTHYSETGPITVGLGTAATESSFTEPTSGQYSTYTRQTIAATQSGETWTLANSTNSANNIAFPALAGSDTGCTITHAALFDNAGQVIAWTEVQPNVPLVAGDNPEIAPNTLTLRIL